MGGKRIKDRTNGHFKDHHERDNAGAMVATYPSGKPVKICSTEEMDRRISIVESWMRKGMFVKYHLRKRIKKKWDIEWRQADKYVQRAKERLVIYLNQTREEHRAESLAFYAGMTINPNAAFAEQLRARERIDKLLGLEQPMQIKAEITARPSGISVDSLDLESKKKLLKNIRNSKLIDTTVEESLNGDPVE